MHNGVPDNAGTGGEFWMTGRGIAVEDSDVWAHVAELSSYDPPERYVLFEMQLSEGPLPRIRRTAFARHAETVPPSVGLSGLCRHS